MKNIAAIRKDYTLETLDEKMTGDDPFSLFDKWWEQAINSDIDEVNAMTLATVNSKHIPSARIVLLKGYDKNGFVFFTNYNSHKATDILDNPRVSLVIFWKELQRQIRINGMAEKVSGKESDDYFNSRPEKSKIGAWASPQSNIIASREVLEKNEAEYENQFAGKSIPRPAHWGGFIVKPLQIEFWQGRASRLHDRICYSLLENGGWRKERLAP